ncbi:MAG: hypothetical protein A2W80_08350 [Candidatus Riflebacteria bacterium GWC2_50_8]|nr:MAG: hypothetical protein A2W80_08350 [Candidatus Riflebacteria bacterium GWC2_50_8]
MIEYALETNVRIDWSDLDSLGHVNNLAIMRYMQTVTVLYLEKLGLLPNNKTLEVGPIMASVSGQFKKQIHYPGDVRVISTVNELRTTSFHIKHHVIDEKNDIAAEGHNIIVIFDFKKNVKHAIPADLREKIEKMESAHKTFNIRK